MSHQAVKSNHAEQCVVNPKTGRLECVFVNLEAVYPEGNGGAEYCFEELRARHRGWMDGSLKQKTVVKGLKATATSEMPRIDQHELGRGDECKPGFDKR